jgi:hypothetical protein
MSADAPVHAGGRSELAVVILRFYATWPLAVLEPFGSTLTLRDRFLWSPLRLVTLSYVMSTRTGLPSRACDRPATPRLSDMGIRRPVDRVRRRHHQHGHRHPESEHGGRAEGWARRSSRLVPERAAFLLRWPAGRIRSGDLRHERRRVPMSGASRVERARIWTRRGRPTANGSRFTGPTNTRTTTCGACI